MSIKFKDFRKDEEEMVLDVENNTEHREISKKIQEEMFGMEIVEDSTGADITFGVF